MANPKNDLEYALNLIYTLNIGGFFDFLSNKVFELDKGMLNSLKNEYIAGETDEKFPSRLVEFAKQVLGTNTDLNPITTRTVIAFQAPKKTIWRWFQRAKLERCYDSLRYEQLQYNTDTIKQATDDNNYLPLIQKIEVEPERQEEAERNFMDYDLGKAFEDMFFKRNTKVAILLGETGMGKTTFLQKLFIQKAQAYTPKKMAFVYCDDNTDAQIKQAVQQDVQWLWIDAFDEDIQAKEGDYQKRFLDIIKQAEGTAEKIIISSRTQFLPEDRKLTQLMGASFWKVEVGMFVRWQVTNFTAKKYLNDNQKRELINNILLKDNSVLLRPLVVSHAELLADTQSTTKKDYNYLYEIYADIIDYWAKREQDKENHAIAYAENMLTFCEDLALYLYKGMVEKQHNDHIGYLKLEEKRQQLNVGLTATQVRSRTLLSRDGFGNYRFAHKGFLEYFVAKALFKGKISEEEFPKKDMYWQDTYLIYEQMCRHNLASLRPKEYGVIDLQNLENSAFSKNESILSFPNLFIRALSLRYQEKTSKKLPNWGRLLDILTEQIKCDTKFTQEQKNDCLGHYIFQQYNDFLDDKEKMPADDIPYYTRNLLAEHQFMTVFGSDDPMSFFVNNSSQEEQERSCHSIILALKMPHCKKMFTSWFDGVNGKTKNIKNLFDLTMQLLLKPLEQEGFDSWYKNYVENDLESLFSTIKDILKSLKN